MRVVLLTIALVICLSALSIAMEAPADNSIRPSTGSPSGNFNTIEPRPIVSDVPIWKNLEMMTFDEKANSNITLEIGREYSEEVTFLVSEIEYNWNRGHHEKAVLVFQELGDLIDLKDIAISNHWLNPLPTIEDNLWGTDVRIGNRDESYAIDFDIHKQSGNLFTVMVWAEAAPQWYQWSLFFSSNGGATWSETHTWTATYVLDDVDVSIVDNYCNVAYIADNGHSARLRRFDTADGGWAYFPDSSTYVEVLDVNPYAAMEVNLISNQDYYNNRLYYFIRTSEDVIKYFWDDTDAISWSEVATGIVNADDGLDACCNEGYSDYYAFLSYYDDDSSTVNVYGNRGIAWDFLYDYPSGTDLSNTYTSIGAYHDTITCAFEVVGPPHRCRYLVSYTGGDNWLIGNIDDPDTVTWSPGLTARDGGGVGIAYALYGPTPSFGMFTYRDYGGVWDTPIEYSDIDPGGLKPIVEYLGDGIFGVVYAGPTAWSPIYFDRHYTAETPPVSIYMDPHDPPVTVAPGGSFSFTGTIRNNTGVNRTVDVGIYLYVPWGGIYGPINVFYDIPLGPYETYSDPGATQYIPGYAIPGNYTYICYCGDYPTPYDSAWFDFTISGTVANENVNDWMLSGWFGEEIEVLPQITSLHQSYPNPFNAQTTIKYDLLNAGVIDLSVYNIMGQKVEVLFKGEQTTGNHEVVWNAQNYASGIYFYKLTTDKQIFSKRMTLLK
ncbi:MAG: T9SS type A sorting domain-containing protein [candidate division Zixibacteria bacterium]|nr:T9SS type A sorting domain-containing protein [candidate division Zixibacteria bacterium]